MPTKTQTGQSKDKPKYRKPGQPTKFRESYCQMLMSHMADGYSFESFGAIIDVCADTLYEWAKVHPEFSESKRRGELKSLHLAEQTLRASQFKRDMNPTPIIYSMRCRFRKYGWNQDSPQGEEDPNGFQFYK